MTKRSADAMTIPQTTLGSTGRTVSILGLGGEGVLRTFGYEREARAMVEAALEAGITYFESARAYSDSEAYLGKALQGHRDGIFLTSKSHGRTRGEAEEHLATTLQNLKTDHLDLWQVHDVRTRGDLEELSAPGGLWRCSGGPRRRAMPEASASPATTTRPYCGKPWTFTTSTRCSCR